MEKSLRVLLVEDDPADALLLERALGEGCVHLAHVECLAEALELLRQHSFDLVLLDLSLPDADGLDTVRRARSGCHSPIIVMTGRDDEELAVHALQHGAQDYLVKGSLDGDRILRSMRYALERHRLSLEVEQGHRQELDLKDQFLSHISHELRTPLAVVDQFVSLVLDGLGGELLPRQVEFLEIARRNTEQLKTMIHDLLEVTRAGAGKLSIHCEPFSVEVLLEQARSEFSPRASARGHDILVRCPKPVPVVDVDPARVRQVLSNLVDNAFKFTQPPGRIVLEVRQRDLRWVCVSVSDTGCGVSSDARERIFERLHQECALGEEGRRGLGLGLYISRELVKAMGGRIWVEPREEGGSIFLFTLPVASGSPGAATKSGRRPAITEPPRGCDDALEEEIPGARS